jgi:hypothetical protein
VNIRLAKCAEQEAACVRSLPISIADDRGDK